MVEAGRSATSPTGAAGVFSAGVPCPTSPQHLVVQDKAGESAMQAMSMLESMFGWLLQPARSDEVELPLSPTAAAVSGQPASASEVITKLEQGWTLL